MSALTLAVVTGSTASTISCMIMRISRGDIRIIMQEMVLAVDPVTTARVRADIQFIFTDTASVYHITIDKGTARCEMVETGEYDIRIITTAPVWVGIIH